MRGADRAIDGSLGGPDTPAQDDPQAGVHAPERADLARIALVSVAATLSGLHVVPRAGRLDLVALVAAVAGGYPIYHEAYAALREHRMTMELSMTIAIGAALAIGEFFTAVVIVLFVLVAEVLEGLTVGRGRRAIKDLLDVLPRAATVRRGGAEQRLAADAIRPGDVVLVKPGERIPVDGTVAAGHSFVDQATITGESIPVEKLPGEQVYAGTVNQSGALDVEVTRVGRDTAFGRIIDAVERAEESRAPIQKTADRLAGYLVYFALGCAALTLLLTRDARATISVVIVAGACGIAAGTPLAILGAIGRAARLGAVVKGGLYLEVLGRVDTAVFDKTGTLTLGAPTVEAVRCYNGATEAAVVATAAIAEQRSEHPLARAVLAKATELGLTPSPSERFAYAPGKGISCDASGDEILVGSRAFLAERGVDVTPCAAPSGVFSDVLVSRGGRLLGAIDVADAVRPEASTAVAQLRAMGLRTILLTGDTAAIGGSVGRSLGLDEVAAELLPAQKESRVRELIAAGRTVAMVGDGINDAPALMAASVGIAMGSGTDVAREGADVILVGNDLLKLVETVRIARRCRRIIWQNFVGTLSVDGVGVGLAAFGVLNPLLAAFIHVASELVFILNSTRLLPPRKALVTALDRRAVAQVRDQRVHHAARPVSND